MHLTITVIKELEKFAPRLLGNEKKARKFLESLLSLMGIDYQLQKFKTRILFSKIFYLRVDGEEVECLPTAFKSGRIQEKNLISSMAVSGEYYEEENINFNPYSSQISLATFYRAPSLAIKRKDIIKVIKAEEIDGKVRVIPKSHTSANILVGNLKKPRNILIAHYDSILNGAADDAAGVALLFENIKIKSNLKKNLFVISGCEELSYDKPIYWGKGYRIFEEEFHSVLRLAKRIIIVDMVGLDRPILLKSKKICRLAFPIKDTELWRKTLVLSSSGNKWKEVYHTRLDTIGNIKKRFLEKALRLILRLIK